jgi:hypothetical protein
MCLGPLGKETVSIKAPTLRVVCRRERQKAPPDGRACDLSCVRARP